MKDLFATIVILILALGIAMQSYFVNEYQQTTEEALEIAGRWQEAYTELQQDYSLAVEKIEWLEYKLGVKSE